MWEYRYSLHHQFKNTILTESRIVNNRWKEVSSWGRQLKGVNETEFCSEVPYTQQKLSSFAKHLNNI
jgi:hypothetical protein